MSVLELGFVAMSRRVVYIGRFAPEIFSDYMMVRNHLETLDSVAVVRTIREALKR